MKQQNEKAKQKKLKTKKTKFFEIWERRCKRRKCIPVPRSSVSSKKPESERN